MCSNIRVSIVFFSVVLLQDREKPLVSGFCGSAFDVVNVGGDHADHVGMKTAVAITNWSTAPANLHQIW
eukprot:8355899-Prorocentrum_lima.AAC.1